MQAATGKIGMAIAGSTKAMARITVATVGRRCEIASKMAKSIDAGTRSAAKGRRATALRNPSSRIRRDSQIATHAATMRMAAAARSRNQDCPFGTT